jgi:hypothetical protein
LTRLKRIRGTYAAEYAAGERYVGRFHVGATNREIIRACLNRVADNQRHCRSWRDARHAFIRGALIAHAANRELYRYVQRGGR